MTKIIEVEDGGNMSIVRRLEANGFHHNEKRDYLDPQAGTGVNVEVWVKRDGSKGETYIDISDLPEVE